MKNESNKIKPGVRNITSGILLIVVSLWAIIAIFSYSYPDYFTTDSFIYPPPRNIENWGGPAGAMFAFWAINTFGYLVLAFPIILISIGIFRLFSLPSKKVLRLAGIIIAGQGILSTLFALPGGNLSERLSGKYGMALSDALISLIGKGGAYTFTIILFLAFVIIISGFDLRRLFQSSSQSLKKLLMVNAARKERKNSREKSSRQELLDNYRKDQFELRDKSSSGKIIPGVKSSQQKPPNKESLPEEEIEEEKEERYSRASHMEFIPPPIRKPYKEKEAREKLAPEEKKKYYPPPPHADTINPEKIRERKEASLKNGPTMQEQPRENHQDSETPKLGHEPPLPEPVLEDAEQTISSKSQKPDIKQSTPVLSSAKKTVSPDSYSYDPPGYDILITEETGNDSISEDHLHDLARCLMETLKSFNVDGKITEICPGPVITRYELEPAVGIKVSRIANLADDIALALRAKDIRIVAPIPGKGAVGIEVPNKVMSTVRIKSILKTDVFNDSDYKLPLALGKRVDGSPAVVDLTKMPHLLIAGATGSGKSVCINSIITSLVYKSNPVDVRLIMIDPKRLELSVYKNIPHLAAPIVVEPKHASIALNWAVEEMEARYDQLSTVGARSIAEYNDIVSSKGNELKLQKLGYLVVIVDELADLMVLVASEIEEPIARLAQMARAVGIHMVIATQRPSVDVITGLIKANFPSRIAFKVRSKIDSRTILDMNGSERLLGRGDMLYLPSGYAEPIRIHGSLITTAETERVVDHLRDFPNPYPDDMLDFDEKEQEIAIEGDRDDLFWEAAKLVVMYNQGSTSFLQRKLRVGYTRAGSIIDQLEQAGIVGPFQGSKARDVLIDNIESLDKLKEQ